MNTRVPAGTHTGLDKMIKGRKNMRPRMAPAMVGAVVWDREGKGVIKGMKGECLKLTGVACGLKSAVLVTCKGLRGGAGIDHSFRLRLFLFYFFSPRISPLFSHTQQLCVYYYYYYYYYFAIAIVLSCLLSFAKCLIIIFTILTVIFSP